MSVTLDSDENRSESIRSQNSGKNDMNVDRSTYILLSASLQFFVGRSRAHNATARAFHLAQSIDIFIFDTYISSNG